MPNSNFNTTIKRVTLKFGADATNFVPSDGSEALTVNLAIPVIGNSAAEEMIASCDKGAILIPSGDPRIKLLNFGDQRVAVAVAPIKDGLAAATESLYQRLFQLFEGRQIYRFWSYVPDINQVEDDHENYWRFNAGRHTAYRAHYGDDCEAMMPAASAVGCSGDSLVVVAIGGTHPVTHFENPRQVPSYRYPQAYGPKPPSFARGTVVWTDHQQTTPHSVILSGTSSIVGHQTVGQESITDQIEVTIENMRIVIDQMHVASRSEESAPLPDHAEFKIYLRYPEHADEALAALTKAFAVNPSRVVILESAICRPDLDVEMEGRW